jgi:hypothetical protein
VVSAVQGNHGNYHLTSKTKNSHLSISPLMSIYWFFELSAIVDRNMFFSQILSTRTVGEALLNIMMVLRFVKKRSPSRNTFG